MRGVIGMLFLVGGGLLIAANVKTALTQISATPTTIQSTVATVASSPIATGEWVNPYNWPGIISQWIVSQIPGIPGGKP